jgi:large subunit ribosomal protein L31
MKKKIHPKYYKDVQVTCSCGNTFVIGGATKEYINTDFCNKCHPAYTGTKKVADTANRVHQFEEKMKKSEEKMKAAKNIAAQKEKRQKATKDTEGKGEITLKDILKDMKKAS